MLKEWSRRILALVVPLYQAELRGRGSRAEVLGWAEELEAIAAEMRSKVERRS